MSKKTRGPNFSSNEKDILVHLVTKYKDVVENKKTDAVTTLMKNEGWKKLAEEFNPSRVYDAHVCIMLFQCPTVYDTPCASCKIHFNSRCFFIENMREVNCLSSFYVRNVEQLKTCWDNVKRTTRKDKAATKKHIFLTGGGRPDIPPPGPLQGQVEMLLGPSLDGLNNPYDTDIQFSDTVMDVIDEKEVNAAGSSSQTFLDVNAASSSQKTQDDKTAGALQTFELGDDNIPTDDVEKKTWNCWTPTALKTKVSNTLSVNKENNPSTWLHRRRPKTSLQDKVLQSKLELIDIMKKNVQTEAALKELVLQEQLKQEILKTEKLQLEVETMKNKT